MMLNVGMIIPDTLYSVMTGNEVSVWSYSNMNGLSFDNDPNVSDADRRFCIYEYTSETGFKHYKIVAHGYIYRGYLIGTQGAITYGLNINYDNDDWQDYLANEIAKPPKTKEESGSSLYHYLKNIYNYNDGTYQWWVEADKNLNELWYHSYGFVIGETPDLTKDGDSFVISMQTPNIQGCNQNMRAPIVNKDNDGTYTNDYRDGGYPKDTTSYKIPWVVFLLNDGNSIVSNNWDEVEEYINTGEYPWIQEDDDNSATTDTGTKDVDDSFEDMCDNEPSTTAITTQCTNWYYIKKDQLQECLNFFWTITDDWTALIFNQFTGLYSNLSQCMIQLKYVPHSYANVISQGIDGANILIGKYTSNATAIRIAKETVSIYSASISWDDIKSKMHGNFLDLPPYSTYYLYLPYVGVVPLDGHLFHKRGIKVNYKLDLPTGIATVGIYEEDHNSLVQEYQAQMAVDIPFALTDTLDTIKKAVDSIGSIATSAITSATAVHTLSKTQKTPSTGTTALLGAKIAVDGFKSLSNDISDGIDLKGNITPANALKMFQKPTVIIETVNASYPKNYGKIVGYPCNAKKQLKNLSGFTTCVDPQITFSSGSPTSAEISDIYALLKEGVIL